MILAVDIGNTNVTVGGFLKDSLTFVARMATNPSLTEDEYAAKLRDVLSLHRADVTRIRGAVLSSVVPPLTAVIKSALFCAFGVEALTVGPGVKTGLNIRCDDPSSVGADLICACVAAKQLYGAPLLIVDMGTATKIMLVDKSGAFGGVSILCGAQTALYALTSSAAQLPQVSLEAPASVIGKNTADCIRSGAVFGHAAMIDGMIDRIESEAGEKLKVIATGELSSAVIPYCTHFVSIDETLVLKGLHLIQKKNP